MGKDGGASLVEAMVRVRPDKDSFKEHHSGCHATEVRPGLMEADGCAENELSQTGGRGLTLPSGSHRRSGHRSSQRSTRLRTLILPAQQGRGHGG